MIVQSLEKKDCPAKIVICKVIHALVAGIKTGIGAIVEPLTKKRNQNEKGSM